MNDTFVTFRGWVGGDVRHRMAKDVHVATFRVGATPRIKRGDQWVDGETTWYTVTAWRQLAENLSHSIRKGDPVFVHGRLRSETWTPEEGQPSTTLQVEALMVGHDLTRGTTHFSKPRRDAVAGSGTGQDERPAHDQVPPSVEADLDVHLEESVEEERLADFAAA